MAATPRKKSIVLTVETDTYDTHKAMKAANELASIVRESTGTTTLKVAGVAVK